MNERVFYVEHDADLSELSGLLKSTKADTVVFVLPRKSVLFESIVNLQILRREAEDLSKTVVIISSSSKGSALCYTAGIECHPSLEHWEKKVPADSVEAKKNDPTPVKKIQRVQIHAEEKGKKKSPPRDEPVNWRELFSRPSWQALIVLLVFSLGLFFFLSFLAFPGATIAIQPEKKGLEIITNIQINNPDKNPGGKRDSVSGYPIQAEFEKKIDFPTLTKIFKGTNASGTLTIYNSLGEERRLRPTTRFQTESGIIFRITDWATVPGASRGSNGKLVPGSIRARVVADEKDTLGEFVGDRGNIPAGRFFLPGLSADERKIVWAESTEPFSGGKSDWSPRVQEADITAAKAKIEAEILSSAEESIKGFVREKNAREQRDLELLLGDKFIDKKILEITIEENILGTEKQSFAVSAKMNVKAWAYSKAELYQILWEGLAAKADSKMRLVEIDIDQIAPELLEKNEAAGYLKISVTARGAEEYLIDPRSEAGVHFVNEVKSEILGKTIEEAEAIIGNREEVSAVSISVWPFWSNTISTLPENVSIKLEEGTQP